MKHTPTDQAILSKIYEKYYDEFASYSKDQPSRASKIYIPIDVQAIADELKVDGDIVFGRLYYDLEQRYGYKQDDGSRVSLFALSLANERHCINFPYAASILAALRDDNRRYNTSTAIALISLAISIVSICLSVFLR